MFFQICTVIAMIICSFTAAIVLSATTEMPFLSLIRLYNNLERMQKNTC